LSRNRSIEGEPSKRLRIFRSDKDCRDTIGDVLAEYDSEIELLSFA